MRKQPPKQPTVPLMPRTISPNNIIRLDDNTPLILDNRVCNKQEIPNNCILCMNTWLKKQYKVTI